LRGVAKQFLEASLNNPFDSTSFGHVDIAALGHVDGAAISFGYVGFVDVVCTAVADG
jgi:hypothetical protein